MVELKSLGAVIAVSNYSNIQPIIETDSLEDGLKYLSDLAKSVGNNDYADSVAKAPSAGEVKLKALKAMDGTEVYFNPKGHTYTDPDGKVKYLSGSTFASLVVTSFDAQSIAQKVAKDGLTADQVLKLWDMKNQVACDYGDAIHKAMETYQKFHVYGGVLGGEEKILPNSPYLAELVKSFFTEERKKEQALPEVFVANKELGLCGVIDRLVFLDKDSRTVEIQDFKSNDLEKKTTFIKEIREAYPDVPKNRLGEYYFQLSFYATILKKMGYNVKTCRIFNLNDTQWDEESFKPLDLTKALEIVRGSKQPYYGGSSEASGWGDN